MLKYMRVLWGYAWRVSLSLFISIAPLFIDRAVPLSASSSIDITVTATPLYSVGPPTNFTLTVVNNHEIDMAWGLDPLAVLTLIIGKQGSYPTDRTDGYQVYSGTGITTSDTTVSLDELGANMYYNAYEQDGSGNWSLPAQANIGGKGMTIIGYNLLIFIFLLVAIIPMVVAWTTKYGMFAVISVFGWILFGISCYVQSTTDTTNFATVYYWAGWGSIFMAFMAGLEWYNVAASKRVPKAQRSFFDSDDGALDPEGAAVDAELNKSRRHITREDMTEARINARQRKIQKNWRKHGA